MEMMYLAKKCGGSSGKYGSKKRPAIPALTKFWRKEKGWWIRLRADLTFMEKIDEGYYEIKWDGEYGCWKMLDQDGDCCHKNPNKNPEDMSGKDGKGGWRIGSRGVAPAPKFIKPTTEAVRCYAKPVNPPKCDHQ